MSKAPVSPPPVVPEGWVPMRALTSRTGVTRATVLHYVAIGILPEPVRTSRNMAFYAPDCVGLIELVRDLQTSSHLPLSVIADLVNQQGHEKLRRLYEATRATQRDILTTLRGSDPVSRAELLAIDGIAEHVLEDLDSIGLIVPQGANSFDPLSRQIVHAVAVMRRAGLDEEAGFRVLDLKAYRDALAALVAKEMELFNSRLLGGVPAEEAERIIRSSLAGAEALILAIRNRLLVSVIEADIE